MVERITDKQIRVLEKICNFKDNSLDNRSLKISEKDLRSIVDYFSINGWLRIEGISPVTYLVEGTEEEIVSDYIDIHYEILDRKQLLNLLNKLQKDYPKRQKPLMREKTLELISQKIGNLDTGNNLVKFLRNCGVDEELIIYPNTKWRMVFDALVYLSCSGKGEDEDALSKAIGEATHPLMHGGDASTANALREEFNNYLHYDNFGVAYDKTDGSYWALRETEDKDDIKTAMEDEVRDYEEQNEEQLQFLSQPENKEKISLLRKSYQLLMSVVFVFCENPARPTVELNQNFQSLYKLINGTISELDLWLLDTSPFSRNQHFFSLPFSNLFSAEKAYKEQGKELSWQRIRPEMNAMYGDIEELYQEVSGSDILAEPDKQKKLNEIQLALSVLKKKRGMAKKMQMDGKVQPVIPAARIEITKLPELQIKGFEEKVVLQKPKNKKIQLRKFPSNLRWEEISIQFLNEHEVIIKARNNTLQTTYEAMGFQDDKRKLPNKQWQFLRLLALKNGEISWESNQNLPLKQINSIKKQKQLLTEALKAYFQISNDEPFHDYKTEKAYRIKLALTPEPKLKDIDKQEVYDE